jgi:hypothetical protein
MKGVIFEPRAVRVSPGTAGAAPQPHGRVGRGQGRWRLAAIWLMRGWMSLCARQIDEIDSAAQTADTRRLYKLLTAQATGTARRVACYNELCRLRAHTRHLSSLAATHDTDTTDYTDLASLHAGSQIHSVTHTDTTRHTTHTAQDHDEEMH